MEINTDNISFYSEKNINNKSNKERLNILNLVQSEFKSSQLEIVETVFKTMLFQLMANKEIGIEDFDKAKDIFEKQLPQKIELDSQLNKELTLQLAQDIVKIVEPLFLKIGFEEQFSKDLLQLQLMSYVSRLQDLFSSEFVMMIFRAESGAEDALMSYLDNIVAMKGAPIVKDDSLYSESTEDIMANRSFFEIFCLDKVNELTLDEKDQADNRSIENVEYCILPNIAELMIFDELLKDKIPLGILQYHLYVSQLQSNSNQIVFRFVLLYKQDIILNFTFKYIMKDQLCLMYSKGLHIGTINYSYDPKKQLFTKLNGNINGSIIALIVKKQLNRFNYKVLLGEWKGEIHLNSLNHTVGTWRSRKIIKKKFDSKSHKLIKEKNKLQVRKNIIIGEDCIVSTSLYMNKLPIPLWMSGTIKNNKFEPPKSIPLERFNCNLNSLY